MAVNLRDNTAQTQARRSRKMFSKGRWQPELCKHVWAELANSTQGSTACLAFDIQHCIAGLATLHLDQLDQWQSGQAAVHWPLFWRLLSAEIEMGLPERARARLLAHPAKHYNFRQQTALGQFPMALDYCKREFPSVIAGFSSRHARRAEKLLATTTDLPAWTGATLSKSKSAATMPRIAVVGNGPSLSGRGAGEHIDQADLVIRFNKVHTDGSFKIDTGQRTDLWVISPGMKLKPAHHVCPDVCVSGPAPFMRSSRYWRNLSKQGFRSVSLAPLDSWHRLVKKLAAPPSAGLLILDSLTHTLPALNIEVHGISIAASNGQNRICGADGQHYGDKHTASERHNWQGEAELIRDWISSGKVFSYE